MFNFSITHLERLIAAHHYAVTDNVVLFALRGCLPTNLQDVTKSELKPLRQIPVDYQRLRCTVGWADLQNGQLMACPASTVPHQKHIQKALKQSGQGTNCLMPGLLRFVKGTHPGAGGYGSHVAFRQAQPFPHQRTQDDLDYDDDDVITVGSPGDNLHAGYTDTTSSDFPANFESAGCVVVAGFPVRLGDPKSRDIGCWPRLRDAAYASAQDSFSMVLAYGGDGESVASAPPDSVPCLLRFGSTGPLVEKVQRALANLGLLDPGKVDSRYGRATLNAVVAFQRREKLSVDGTCALHTADALGIEDWPVV
jgi:hypothetical protein